MRDGVSVVRITCRRARRKWCPDPDARDEILFPSPVPQAGGGVGATASATISAFRTGLGYVEGESGGQNTWTISRQRKGVLSSEDDLVELPNDLRREPGVGGLVVDSLQL